MNDLDEEARQHGRSSNDDYSVIYGTSNGTLIDPPASAVVSLPSSIYKQRPNFMISGKVYQSLQRARITM